ncbi:uncharacterized protein [Typha angustifolia]|uniref:uncharacterized protein n=1 Tax=Typha angustifolia TaxID=59011 RepID=UPI003C2CC5A2
MVYASNHLEAQKELWEELTSMATINSPWVLTEDFNAFLSPQEKRCSGGVELGPKCKAFARFVDDSGLCNLGYEGIPYIWCNNQAGDRCIRLRLDRAVGNTEWLRANSTCKVQHLDQAASAHTSLLLNVPLSDAKVRRPFTFELYWMEYEECQKIVEDTWTSLARGNPMHAFMHHISDLRRNLRKWS